MSNPPNSDQNWKSGQAAEGIVTLGDPALRRSATPVDEPLEVQALLAQMVARLRAMNGAGLAATQLGHDEAIAIIEVRKTDLFPDRPVSPLIQMVNPRITWTSPGVEPGWEGCFSVPGLMGIVDRPYAIEIAYIDENGMPQASRLEGYVARVVQHEIDHLHGIVYLDRMSSMKTLTTVVNYERFYAGRPIPGSPQDR